MSGQDIFGRSALWLSSSEAARLSGKGLSAPTVSCVANDQTVAAANRQRIEQAQRANKKLVVGAPEAGPIFIDRTLVLLGGVHVEPAPGSQIKLAPGKTCPLFRNAAAQAVIPASGINHSLSGEATFTERGHNREVGSSVLIYNVGGDATLLGFKTVIARGENTWTVAAAGTGTATGIAFVAPADGNTFDGGAIKRGEAAVAVCNINGTTMTVVSSTNGVPFVDGMTITGGTLSGQEIHGPLGAVQEGAGSTWELSASGGTQVGVTVTGTPPANLVRVVDPGHDKVDGDPVWIGNFGGADSFNGPRRVFAALPSCWYYMTDGATQEAATGTGVILHDALIKLRGEWDGNYVAQSGAYYNAHGGILGNCAFDVADMTVGGCFKYALWGFNNAKVSGHNLRFVTRSDGLHLEAPWTHVRVNTVFGRNADDIVSFTDNQLDSTWPELSSPSGSGDSDDAVVENIFAEWSPNSSIVKLAADLDHSVGTFIVRGVFGRAENGVYLNRDIVGSGCKGRALVIEDIFVEGTQAGSSPVKINADDLGMWESIRIKNVPIIGTKNSPSIYIQSAAWQYMEIDPGYVAPPNVNPYIQMDGGAIGALTVYKHAGAVLPAAAIKFINLNGPTLGELCWLGGSLSGSGNGYGIWQEGGTLGKLRVGALTIGAINQFFAQKAGLTTSPMDVFATGVHVDSGAVPNAVFATYSNVNVIASACRIEAVNNFFFAPQSGTNRLVASDDCSFPAGKAMKNAAGLTNSATGRGVQLDLGENAGSTPAGMSPTPGDVVWNTNATGGGLYGRSAAGSWVSIF